MRRHPVKFFPLFQPKTVRMTILGRLTTLTHLDDTMVTEEEAADAVQMAASSKINQVNIFLYRYLIYCVTLSSTALQWRSIYLYISGCSIIQSGLLKLLLVGFSSGSLAEQQWPSSKAEPAINSPAPLSSESCPLGSSARAGARLDGKGEQQACGNNSKGMNSKKTHLKHSRYYYYILL